jgi:hypothetical protein
MANVFHFGDFFTYGSSDVSNCIIIGRTTENSGSPAGGNNTPTNVWEGFSQFINTNSTMLSNVVAGHFVAASYTGVGGSIFVGKHTDFAKMGIANNNNWWFQMGRLGQIGQNQAESQWTTEFVYPNPPDSGLYVAPVWIHHNGFVRGYLKGCWSPLQHLPINHNDTYTGTGNMSGKSLLSQMILGSNNNNSASPAQCQVHIETSDTWS